MIGKLANGFLCFGPASFVTCAFILSQFASKGCQFIKLAEGEDVSRVQGVMDYMGIYCWRSAGGVDFIYDGDFDYSSEHELAQKMALATTVMGATAWGTYFLASCIRFPPFLWLIISLTLVATCICQGIMFKLLDTERCQLSECGLGTSSKCGIAACVFWGLSSFMTCGIFKEARDRKNGDGEE